jgi:cell division protein FtsW
MGAPILIVLFLAILLVLNTPDKYLKNAGRVLTWKHRIENYQTRSTNSDETYQNDHAKIAIANGGLIGVGPGGSTERNFLPQAYSDFIYAIITEEYGFFGAVLMMGLYLLFMYRAFRIIFKSPKAFGALLAVGLSFALVLQALINMAIAVNLVPNTGLTLPLVSKGGTSIVITSFAFGLIMSVSRYVEEYEPNEAENKIAS